MIELEKKVLLTKAEYECLINFCGIDARSFIQMNYYYDSDDFRMNDMGITYRIREKSGKYKSTVKKHCFGVNEQSLEKSREAKSQFDNSFFKNKDIKLQGSLETYRTVIAPLEGIEIAIDKNIYLDFTDYELEIEYTEDNENIAQELFYYYTLLLYTFANTNILEFRSRSKKSKSKSQRFFDRKRAIT